jgi:hypothetical protein
VHVLGLRKWKIGQIYPWIKKTCREKESIPSLNVYTDMLYTAYVFTVYISLLES